MKRKLAAAQLILAGALLTAVTVPMGNPVQAQIKPVIIDKTDGQWTQDANGWWYKYADGSYPRNKWDKINGKYYYFNVHGYLLTGWQQLKGFGDYKETSWYYFDPTNGDMQTGWQKINGKWYYLDPAEGYMLTGVQQVGKNNECYYFHPTNGDMQTGWYQLPGTLGHPEPAWFYFDPADGSMATGWKQIDGKWYQFDSLEGFLMTE